MTVTRAETGAQMDTGTQTGRDRDMEMTGKRQEKRQAQGQRQDRHRNRDRDTERDRNRDRDRERERDRDNELLTTQTSHKEFRNLELCPKNNMTYKIIFCSNCHTVKKLCRSCHSIKFVSVEIVPPATTFRKIVTPLKMFSAISTQQTLAQINIF